MLSAFFPHFLRQTKILDRFVQLIAAGGVLPLALAAMGRMSSAEWRALAVFVLVTCLWATQGLTGLDTTVVCLMGACLLFLPRFGVIDWSDAKGVFPGRCCLSQAAEFRSAISF